MTLPNQPTTEQPHSSALANLAVCRAALANALVATTLDDLAIVPVVVTTQPGVGTTHVLQKLASGLEWNFLEYRFDMMDIMTDFGNVQVLDAGEVKIRKGMPEGLHSLLTGDKPAMVVIDFSFQRPVLIDRMVTAIKETATVHTVVVFKTHAGLKEFAIEQAGLLNVEKPLVRTVAMSADSTVQDVQLVGTVVHDGSKRGERYVDMTIQEPYEHSLKFTIIADEDQDDDAMNETLEPIWDAEQVAVRLHEEHGYLVARMQDVAAL
jgi:hypothetical protein